MRPDRLSMEGMIWNADQILQQALDPKKSHGIPKELFDKCVGLLLISVVEAGFIFSGSVGTGILLKKKEEGWSKPCAMLLGGVGWGFLLGAATKDIMVFIFDNNSLEGMCADAGLRIGGQVNVTVGPVGRNYEGGIGASANGALGTFSVAFSRGAFVSLSVEGALVMVRGGANDQFYGKVTSAQSIIHDDDVEFPEGRPTLIQNVYDSLAKLQSGETEEERPNLVQSIYESFSNLGVQNSATTHPSDELTKHDSFEKINAEDETTK